MLTFTDATLLSGRAFMEDLLARGVHEVPAHSNCTEISHAYGFCAAWCAMTWWEMLNHIGIVVPKEAGVAAVMADAQAGRGGLVWLGRDAVIREGDAALFDWSGRRIASEMHIAAWVRDPGTQAKFLTIAGNESDAVTEQWRDRTYVMGFVRPPFRAGPGPTPLPQEEDDMPYIIKCQDPNHSIAQYLVVGPHVISIPNTAELGALGDDKLVTYSLGSFVFDALVKHLGE